MTAANPASTPIARSKTAALSRVLDMVPKGYVHQISGTCSAEKVKKLAYKFHEQYGIGCSPAQRITRKKQGLANAVLVLYRPSVPESTPLSESEPDRAAGLPGNTVHWLLLATEGAGPIHEQEQLRTVVDTPRLVWLGYELVRHTARDRISWTWRRTKHEMADLHAILGEQLNRRQMPAVEQTLLRLCRQPGFSGVLEQSWALCQLARSRGYSGELPHVYFVQKVSHGERLVL